MSGHQRLHIIGSLIGIFMIGCKWIPLFVLCIMECYFYLAVIRDFNTGKIRNNVIRTSNRNINVLRRYHFIQIQLVFNLFIIGDLLICRNCSICSNGRKHRR